MCGCSVNLAVPQGGNKPPCNCKLHLKNDVKSVLEFVLNNNESEVRSNLADAGIDVSSLSSAQLVTYLELAYAQGYNIAPYVNVTYRNDAENQTGGIATEMYGDGASRLKINIGEVIGIILGGLGAYFGTGVFLNGGNNNPPPPPVQPSVPVWAWVVGGLFIITLLIVLLKR